MAKFRDLTNRKFGRLTVREKTDKRSSGGNVIWRCECTCGNKEHFTSSGNLLSMRSNSCGCLKKELVAKRAKLIDHSKDAEKLRERNAKYASGYTKIMHDKYDFDGTVIHALTAGLSRASKTGHKGVHFDKRRRKYVAYITVRNKRKHLGYFDNIEDAVFARKIGEEAYFHPIIEEYKSQQEELKNEEV